MRLVRKNTAHYPFSVVIFGQEHQVCDSTHEYEDAMKSKGHQEQVEIPVVSFSY